jgi:signal transduction histidine kinase
LKYSPVGAPVEVKLAHDGCCAEISVKDFGQGIPEAEQNRIFDEFYRAQNADAQGVSGNGLGLALVRRIVQAHQGEVSVESAVGEGSLFRVWIPLVSTTKSDLREARS